MKVSDVQVSDEDGHLSRNMTIRASANDDSQFADKIPKERIWTLTSRFRQLNNKIVEERICINPVTSKIMKQPFESDTDAQLHEERVFSARPRADSSSVARCSECRPRADRGAVAKLYVADLEPASLREREREKLQE